MSFGLDMSYADVGSNGSSEQLPSWAQRANEPLVASVDLPALRKSVRENLKEITKAAEKLSKLGAAARKRGPNAPGPSVEPQLLEISAAARERARETSRVLREAVGIVEEGSAEHRAVSALSEEFRQALLKFQQQVEETSHLVSSPAGPQRSDVEAGFGNGGGGGGGGGGGSVQPLSLEQQQQYEAQQSQSQAQEQLETNENVIREREQGITQLNRSVQDVAEIFQDLALLVNEQGSQIDNIQTNIETAANSTQRGVRELARASRTQRQARRTMCIIIACTLALVTILIIVLKSTVLKR